MNQWYIFIILIVSCIITLVAPSNQIIIKSLGMEVCKSPLKFQADCIYTSQDMVFLKSWFSHTFVLWWAGVAHHNTNVWENHDFKNTISCDVYMQSA